MTVMREERHLKCAVRVGFMSAARSSSSSGSSPGGAAFVMRSVARFDVEDHDRVLKSMMTLAVGERALSNTW